MMEEFPFLHVSPQTAHSLGQKQARHLNSILKSGSEAKRTKTQRMIEEAERRQETLVGILKKDLEHNLRMVRLFYVTDNLLFGPSVFSADIHPMKKATIRRDSKGVIQS